MGESGRRTSLGSRNNDRVEANRDHGGRENRQGPPDVRAGSGGRNYGNGDDWSGGLVWIACEYHTRVVLWRGGHDDGEPFRVAMGHRQKSGDGLDFDAAGLHLPLSAAVLDVPHDLEVTGAIRHRA